MPASIQTDVASISSRTTCHSKKIEAVDVSFENGELLPAAQVFQDQIVVRAMRLCKQGSHKPIKRIIGPF
jgi:hypothetical protein